MLKKLNLLGGSLNGGLRRNMFKSNVENKLKFNYFYDLEL